nr:hypothetical protein TetV2_00080 [Oceanusvirus sp.]
MAVSSNCTLKELKIRIPVHAYGGSKSNDPRGDWTVRLNDDRTDYILVPKAKSQLPSDGRCLYCNSEAHLSMKCPNLNSTNDWSKCCRRGTRVSGSRSDTARW